MSDEPPMPVETSYYTPLDDPRKNQDQGEVYDNTPDSLRSAAKEVTDRREAPQDTSDDDGVLTRVYQRLDTGQRIDSHKTVTAERAAHDLAAMRQWEAAVEDHPLKERATFAVDKMREAFPSKEIPATFLQDVQQATVAQAQQPQTEQPGQPEPQPQPEITAQNRNSRRMSIPISRKHYKTQRSERP